MIEVYIYDEAVRLLFVSRTTKRAYYADDDTPVYSTYSHVATGKGWSFTSDNDLFSAGEHTYIGTFSTFDQFTLSHPELFI